MLNEIKIIAALTFSASIFGGGYLSSGAANAGVVCKTYRNSYFYKQKQLSERDYKKYCGKANFVAKCKSGRIEYAESPGKICASPDGVYFWITSPDA